MGKELTNYPIISFKLHCFTAAGIAVAAGCGVGGDSDSDDVKWLKKCEQNEKAHKTEYNENNNNNNSSSTTTTMSQVWSSAWQRRRAEGGGRVKGAA